MRELVDMEQSPDSEELFEQLVRLQEEIDRETELAQIAEQSIVELKYIEFRPLYDEYYGGRLVNTFSVDAKLIEQKGAKRKPRLRDPKGGLTAAGRRHFKRTEGANLKPGVKGPANTPEKMRRKGSFLTRFFTNPSGPMKDDKGRATRLALSAAAWGEPVPQNAEDAARLAAKGRRLLERYAKTKKKVAAEDFNHGISSALGQGVSGKSASIAQHEELSDLAGIISVKSGSVNYGFSTDEQYGKVASRRRLFIREQLAEHCFAQKSLGQAFIPGNRAEMRRINDGIAFMATKRQSAKRK